MGTRYLRSASYPATPLLPACVPACLPACLPASLPPAGYLQLSSHVNQVLYQQVALVLTREVALCVYIYISIMIVTCCQSCTRNEPGAEAWRGRRRGRGCCSVGRRCRVRCVAVERGRCCDRDEHTQESAPALDGAGGEDGVRVFHSVGARRCGWAGAVQCHGSPMAKELVVSDTCLRDRTDTHTIMVHASSTILTWQATRTGKSNAVHNADISRHIYALA